jgi:uncharacterized protein YlxP (DUF503 family)
MAGKMKAFRVDVLRTEKADDDWPFFTIGFVVIAKDAEWAQEIAKEAIGMLELHRGAYYSMRIDSITEIHIGGI